MAQENNRILGYEEYELDVEKVMRDDLPRYFEGIAPAPLTESNINNIPAGAKGAYLLIKDGVPVYAGKTDTRHGFRDRLGRHRHTIQHRRGLTPEDIQFKALRIMVFSNLDVESILIEELRKASRDYLVWNYSGFGSNDPGRNRERQKPADFDVNWPIDVDRPLKVLEPGDYKLGPLLAELKKQLPYIFRYQDVLMGKPALEPGDLRDLQISIRGTNCTMRDVLSLAVNCLPGWQATIFPGRVIFYEESRAYDHAVDIIARQPI